MKALHLFEFCLYYGSENVIRWGLDNMEIFKSLREYCCIDDEGVDQGVGGTLLS
jgi:hypothetical protein